MLERRHHRRFGEELLSGAVVLQHLHRDLLAAQNAEQHIAELALADALVQQQIALRYGPALVEEVLRIDAVLLFALFRQAFEQLRAQAVGVLLVVLRCWNEMLGNYLYLCIFFKLN